ncbi:very short patch repair endonuclease [Burkholderia orbicola]|uniref:very short patch repair endonuclease n=1 Tax=Burkholderia orbicola TaxID=2978683 RepID=UPI00265517E4|nr:very short patch repair endonuclease [Burkholderia orbicola]MDN7773682.1 very short patch repair endonuclease [Burkholderia orbicola]
MATEWHTDQATSARMSNISRENTHPELFVRKLLHGMGYRYVLHDKRLPGCPDIVFPQRRKVIFVHGCFWHGHRCARGALPKTNTELWANKIARNVARDSRNVRLLRAAGWGVAIVWGCSLTTRNTDALKRRLRRFLDALQGT